MVTLCLKHKVTLLYEAGSSDLDASPNWLQYYVSAVLG